MFSSFDFSSIIATFAWLYEFSILFPNPIAEYNCDENILIQTNGTRTLSCNCCSECNPPLYVVLFNNAYNNIINNSININY